MTIQQPHPQRCEHEEVCYEAITSGPALAGEPKCPYDLDINFTRPCKHDTRISHSSATEPMPLRSCFGNFIDCPCDDECIVSLYCADYQKRRLKDSYYLLDDILSDLSGRSCIGAALEKIEEERGKGWLRADIIKTVLGDRT